MEKVHDLIVFSVKVWENARMRKCIQWRDKLTGLLFLCRFTILTLRSDCQERCISFIIWHKKSIKMLLYAHKYLWLAVLQCVRCWQVWQVCAVNAPLQQSHHYSDLHLWRDSLSHHCCCEKRTSTHTQCSHVTAFHSHDFLARQIQVHVILWVIRQYLMNFNENWEKSNQPLRHVQSPAHTGRVLIALNKSDENRTEGHLKQNTASSNNKMITWWCYEDFMSYMVINTG